MEFGLTSSSSRSAYIACTPEFSKLMYVSIEWDHMGVLAKKSDKSCGRFMRTCWKTVCHKSQLQGQIIPTSVENLW